MRLRSRLEHPINLRISQILHRESFKQDRRQDYTNTQHGGENTHRES